MIPQANLMVLAPVVAERRDDLENLLRSMTDKPGTADPENALVPFGRLEDLHFARIVILDDQTLDDITTAYKVPRSNYPIYLAFLCDFDGPQDVFLTKLINCSSAGLRRIFEHCEGFTADSDLLTWIEAHNKIPATSYVNWRGRTMRQVREESALQQALQKYLAANTALAGMQSRELHDALNKFVLSEQRAGRLFLTPEPSTLLGWEIGNLVNLIGIPLLLLAITPFLLLYAPFFIILLRRRERADMEIAPRPTAKWASKLAAIEDHDVTNQFSALGSLKPGIFRRWTLSYVLWIIDYTTRHIFNRGKLARVTTIHFARWVFLDDKKRLFFASNYDGSLDSYMDDFINKVAFGLNVVFSNGIGYPTTNWLILDGAKDEQKFKYFIRRHELPTQVWYNGHPGLTALNLQRNSLIRQGLENPAMTDSQLQQWAQLL
jgi:hypothetical protein